MNGPASPQVCRSLLLECFPREHQGELQSVVYCTGMNVFGSFPVCIWRCEQAWFCVDVCTRHTYICIIHFNFSSFRGTFQTAYTFSKQPALGCKEIKEDVNNSIFLYQFAKDHCVDIRFNRGTVANQNRQCLHILVFLGVVKVYAMRLKG